MLSLASGRRSVLGCRFSVPNLRRGIGGYRIGFREGRLRFFLGRHGGFEATDAFAQSFAEFRKLFGAEYKQGDSENHEHVHRLKQSFKQFMPPLRVKRIESLQSGYSDCVFAGSHSVEFISIDL
jgi:hypothetical protein